MNIILINEGNKYEFDIGPEVNVEYVRDLSGKIFGEEMDIYYKEENLSKYGEKALIKDIIPKGEENIIINVQKLNSKMYLSKASTSITNSPKTNFNIDNKHYYQSVRKKFINIEDNYEKLINDTSAHEHLLDDRFNKIIKLMKEFKKQVRNIDKKLENFYVNNNNFKEISQLFNQNMTNKNLSDNEFRELINKLNILASNYKYIQARNYYQKNMILFLQSKVELFQKINVQLLEFEKQENFTELIQLLEKLFKYFTETDKEYKPIKLVFTNLSFKIEPEEIELLKLKKHKKAYHLSDLPEDIKKFSNKNSMSSNKSQEKKKEISKNKKPFGVFKISNLKRFNDFEKRHRKKDSIKTIDVNKLKNNKTIENEKINNSLSPNNSNKPVQILKAGLKTLVLNEKVLMSINNSKNNISSSKQKLFNKTLDNKTSKISKVLNKTKIEKNNFSNTMIKIKDDDNLPKINNDINIPFVQKRLKTQRIDDKQKKENKVFSDDKLIYKKKEDNDNDNNDINNNKIKSISKKDIKFISNKALLNINTNENQIEKPIKRSQTNTLNKLSEIEDENKKKQEDLSGRNQIRYNKKLLTTLSKESDKDKSLKISNSNSPIEKKNNIIKLKTKDDLTPITRQNKFNTLKLIDIKNNETLLSRLKKKNQTIKETIEINNESNLSDNKDNSLLKIKNNNETKENIKKLTKNLSNKKNTFLKVKENNNNIINKDNNNSLNKSKNTNSKENDSDEEDKKNLSNSNDSMNTHSIDKKKKRKKAMNKYDFII